jgi:hypothetical protein
LDEGVNPFFPPEHYNYFKTRDGKFVSIGNLEKKFQANLNEEFNGLEKTSTKYSKEKVEKVFSSLKREEAAKYVKIFIYLVWK